MPVDVEITRVAHSCMLVALGDDVFLTDPWFVDRPPIYRAGEPRSLAAAELPSLAAVLVSHAHGDHCDLVSLAGAGRSGVMVVGDPTVSRAAAVAGMESFISPAWWDAVEVGNTRITAVPGRHGVPETSFVLSRDGTHVYFAGDSLYIPELDAIPQRIGPISVALLPTNGLRIRPLLDRKVVMDAEDAARLTAVLNPDVVVPHHYAFTSGPFADRLLTRKDRDPGRYLRAAAGIAPRTDVRILQPGVTTRVSPVPE